MLFERAFAPRTIVLGIRARLQHQHGMHAIRPHHRRLAHARLPFSTRSTSSGKTLSPSGVTIISFLRPRTESRPSASIAPMSPV